MLILEPRLNSETNEPTMVLDGVAQPAATETVATQIFWRWDDDDAMTPQYLGETVPGGTLTVPFDLKGRAIRLFQIGYTALGRGTDTNIKQAEQTVYTPSLARDGGYVDIIAGEALTERDIVQIYDDGGTAKARKADANSSPVRVADGWASESVSSGASVRVYLTASLITGLAGLTIGADYYLSTAAGGITATAPSTSGNIRQRVGKALSATVLSFERGEAITIA